MKTSHSSRGSAFITVMIFTFIMIMVVASILGWSITERKLNSRNAYWLEASNAAEALAEYGFTQVEYVFNLNALPSQNYFDPAGTNKLTLPTIDGTSTGNSFFTPNGNSKESHIDTNPLSAADPNGLELMATPIQYIGSPAVAGVQVYESSADPNNTGDTPAINQNIQRRDVKILAKATAVPPNGDPPVTVCVQETISVRGGSPLSKAIYYSNNDLEIFPGPTMNIYGPVAVNGNLFVSSQGSNYLAFHGTVTASGNIYHAWDSTNSAAEGSSGEALNMTSPVYIDNSSGTQVNLKNTYTVAATTSSPSTTITGWMDSTMNADTSLFSSGLYSDTTTALIATDSAGNPTGQLNSLVPSAATNFAGFLSQNNLSNMVATNTPVTNPVGYSLPIDSSGDLPDMHELIEPPTTVSTTDPYYAGKQAVETGKFANKSGLYVKVNISPGAGGADSATISLYGPAGTGTGASTDGPNGGVLLGTVPSGLVGFVPYSTTTSGSYSTPSTVNTPTSGATSTSVTSTTPSVGSPALPTPVLTKSGGLWKWSYPSGSIPYTYNYNYSYTYTVNNSAQAKTTTQNVNVTLSGSGITGTTNSGSATTTNNGSPVVTTLSTAHGSGSGSGSGNYTVGSGSSGSLTYTTSALALAAANSAISAAYSSAQPSASAAANSAANTAASTSASAAAAAAQAAALGSYSSSTVVGTSSLTVSSGSSAVVSGIYDQREQAGIDLVQIDMGKLRQALSDTIGGSNADGHAITTTSGSVWGQGLSTGWNGAVYVDIEPPSGGKASLAVVNGTVSSGSSLIPAVNSVSGLTVATNAPIYVVGNFNADGVNATTSSSSTSGPATTPDDGGTDASTSQMSAEIPVALVGDAVTLLSPNYFGSSGGAIPTTNPSTSGNANAYNSWTNASPTATSSSIEIASAFIVGLVPTTSGSTGVQASSGGAHNLPRFLENWGSKTVAIRGSLVSLFSSRIATGAWSTHYYSPPSRNWGFDQIFKNGHFPPQIPNAISFRRVFSNIIPPSSGSGSYTSLRATAWPSDTFYSISH